MKYYRWCRMREVHSLGRHSVTLLYKRSHFTYQWVIVKKQDVKTIVKKLEKLGTIKLLPTGKRGADSSRAVLYVSAAQRCQSVSSCISGAPKSKKTREKSCLKMANTWPFINDDVRNTRRLPWFGRTRVFYIWNVKVWMRAVSYKWQVGETVKWTCLTYGDHCRC